MAAIMEKMMQLKGKEKKISVVNSKMKVEMIKEPILLKMKRLEGAVSQTQTSVQPNK